jgi:hypothetical protein
MGFLSDRSFEDGSITTRLLGSFWNLWFGDADKLREWMTGRGHAEYENYLQWRELTDSLSKDDVPIFGRRNWRFLELTTSEQEASDALKYLYGTNGIVYGSPILYGQRRDSQYFSYPINEDMVYCTHLYNRVLDPSYIMIKGIDFDIDVDLKVIHFYEDPTLNPLLSVRNVTDDDGNVIDTKLGIWAHNAYVDKQHIYTHFGYVLRIWQKSSAYYKQFISALWDALVLGPSKTAFKISLSALTGIPVALTDETVEAILQEDHALTIITDQNVYEFDADATPTVEVGTVLQQGSTMTDGLRVIVPTPVADWDGIRGLALGPQFLSMARVNGSIFFENKEVSLNYMNKDAEGRTVVQFQVQGNATDVSGFWATVHNNGISQGQTLAEALDTRTNKVGQPAEIDIPPTINPFQFIMDNIFANNAFIVNIKTSQLAPDAPGLSYVANVTKYMPPHTTVIIFIEMDEITDYYSSGDLVDTVEFMGGLHHADAIDTSEPDDYEDPGILVDHGPVFSLVPENCN